VLGFTFIPWLSGPRPARGGLADRLRDGATGLEKEIEGQTKEIIDEARRIDVKSLEAEARRKLEGLAQDRDGRPPDPPPDPGPPR